MDQPVGKHITVAWLIDELKRFEGRLIIQTMFLRGEYLGRKIDNTTSEEVEAWLNALRQINPAQVMIYSLDRDTPVQNLQKVQSDELKAIAARAEALSFKVSVAG